MTGTQLRKAHLVPETMPDVWRMYAPLLPEKKTSPVLIVSEFFLFHCLILMEVGIILKTADSFVIMLTISQVP
jgi:hypothetical protein